MSFAIRSGTATDVPFLREMLGHAARWRPGDRDADLHEVLADDHVVRYIESWGRPGDLAVIAEDAGTRVGAAWLRTLRADRPGYGFISADTPELGIGVVPSHRGYGVGKALLLALCTLARAEGWRRVSLSVERDNPARHLYARVGFRAVGEGGGSITMLRDLD